MSTKAFLFVLSFAVMVLGLVSVGLAETTSYGDYLGSAPSEVDFLGVTEASTTDSLPLFGEPMRADNSLWFFPTTFASEAHDGSSDTTAGTLTMTIRADEGCYLNEIIVSEYGIYSLAGSGGSGTSASVSGTLHIDTGSQVLEVPMDVTPEPPYILPPGCTDEQFIGSIVINLPAGVSQVSFSFEDILQTSSESGTAAYIQKNIVSGPVIGIAVIPEPASMFLLLGGGAALLRRRTA
jgi:hypothetical protein